MAHKPIEKPPPRQQSVGVNDPLAIDQIDWRGKALNLKGLLVKNILKMRLIIIK